MSFLRSTLKIVKIKFEDLFWRSTLWSSYRWRCMYFSLYWRSILKIIIFRSSKKSSIYFFYLIFFLKFFFFYIFKIFRMNLQNDSWNKKLAPVRLEPGTLGLLALHSATLLPGLLWKEGKMSKNWIICVFWWWL